MAGLLADASTKLSLACISCCPPPQAPEPTCQSNTSPTAPAHEAPLPPAVPLNPSCQTVRQPKPQTYENWKGPQESSSPALPHGLPRSGPNSAACSPPKQRAHYLSEVVPVLWGCCLGWRRAVLGGSVDGWRLSHKRCGVSFPVSRGGLSALGRGDDWGGWGWSGAWSRGIWQSRRLVRGSTQS